jgi:predicted CXXCH cytochrome family protein
MNRKLLLMCLMALLAGMSSAAVIPARAAEPFCFECHDDFPKKMKAFKFTHEPAASGDCTACHLDHKDAEKLMLVKEGAALCSECHDNLATGASVHKPVAEGKCTSCHNPHGSSNKKLLVAAGAALCEKCHPASPEMTGKVSHAALDDGCSGCHRPHASENKRLLSKSLILDRLALFDPKQAELCLGCHDLDTFMKPQSEATGFRMGTLNLHALHLNGGAVPNKYGIVKKKDGQTCFACHLPHTAAQEKLLRTEYQCTGTFCYTMRFVQNEKGGTCVVGCHKPKMYSRVVQDPNASAVGTSPGETQVVR